MMVSPTQHDGRAARLEDSSGGVINGLNNSYVRGQQVGSSGGIGGMPIQNTATVVPGQGGAKSIVGGASFLSTVPGNTVGAGAKSTNGDAVSSKAPQSIRSRVVDGRERASKLFARKKSST